MTLLASLAGPALVGVLFLLGAGLKIADPARFHTHVEGLRILPPGWVHAATQAFTAFEAGMGIALLLGWAPGLVLPAAALLLFALSVTTLWSVSTGRAPDCGCTNGLLEVPPWGSVVLNAVFVALLLVGWALGGRDLSPGSPPWKPLAVAATAVLGGAAFRQAARSGRPLLDLSPLRPGKRWRSAWLSGHPPGVTEGERIVVWMSQDCPHCKPWIPVLNAVHAHPDLPAVLAGLGRTEEGDGGATAGAPFRFPVVKADALTMMRLAPVVPTAVLLRDGVIQERWVGGMAPAFGERVRATLWPKGRAVQDGPGTAPSPPGPVLDGFRGP